MAWDDIKVENNGITPFGKLSASEYNALVTAVKARVLESLYDANTILKADADDTPTALTVDEQRLVGRITAGVITGLTATQVKTLLSLDEVANIKINLIATVAPTVNEDSGDGYSVLSRWADITADKEYVCLDATSAAAVWVETTSVGDVSSDSIWDAAGDLVVGTGSDTAAILGLGSALQVMRVNAGATGLEYTTLSGGSITAESFSESVAHLTTDADLGKPFTITSFPAHAQITAIRVRADFTAGQQANTGSALVNDAGGILPTDLSITYDNAVADFAANDYAWLEDECVFISADSGTVLTVTRGAKGTTAAFHDDNTTIVKANHGIRLVLYKDSNKNYFERIIELSSIMTYKGVTDDDILVTGALTGTVTFTNASTAVSGSGTAFTTEVNVGSIIRLDADGTYVAVASVTDNTNLVLIDVYPDTGGAGASTRGDATHFGLTSDVQNLGHNDRLVIEDTVDEICSVQLINHDTVSAVYDFTISVQDVLAAHAVTKDVKKLMLYDLNTAYDSGTTLYGTVFIDEKITGTVNVEVEVFTDSYT